MPACSSDSSRDPVRIQNPSAIERTEGMASVATRTPESRVVMRAGSALTLLVPLTVAAAAAAAAVTATAVARRHRCRPGPGRPRRGGPCRRFRRS